MRMKYSDSELLDRRLSGILPRIDIAGQQFIVDWKQRELRMESDPGKCIGLNGMPMSEDGERYLCLYDFKANTVLHFTDRTIEMPQNMVALEIPSELKLDPVGVARECGLADTFMLDRYPILRDLKARVILPEDTALPDMIRQNITRLEQGTTNKR